jgi:hypothetical protein
VWCGLARDSRGGREQLLSQSHQNELCGLHTTDEGKTQGARMVELVFSEYLVRWSILLHTGYVPCRVNLPKTLFGF